MPDTRHHLADHVESPPRSANDTWIKSYRYLRTAIVVLLAALGVAVFYQAKRQHFHVLSSVSAYYYTPAQAIFVGALIGMAACMIALKGTTDLEDTLLNLGGMFAALVAIVPTSRGEDYKTAVRACQQAGPLLTGKAPTGGVDCPTAIALSDATRANVENNMTTLLVVGFLALVATVLFVVLVDKRTHLLNGNGAASLRWGFGVAFAVWLGALVAYLRSLDWLIDNAHYLAAAGLFLCILAVAVENARRQQGAQSAGAPAPGQKPNPVDVLVSPRRHDLYTWIARAMVAAAVGGFGLWLAGALPLFWFEIAVFALFGAFWMVQTIEQLPPTGTTSAGTT